MREIIKKFNVYQYSELSDEAKAKVRSWYIDDPFRAEELTDMINEDLKNLFPNSELKVEWSLSSCQGDGVNVYGDLCFMDLVNMVQNHLCGDNYKAFENFFSWKEIKTAKFYSEYCVEVKLTYEYEVLAMTPKQAEAIVKSRFDPNFTVDDVKVELKGKEDI